MIKMILTMLLAATCLTSAAAPKRTAKKRAAPKKAPAVQQAARATKPVATPFRRAPYVGAIAADAQTGEILFRDRADALARPASVTKLMTALLVLDDITASKYTLQTPVSAGPMALRQEPSVIGFLDVKTRTPITHSVDTLLCALMVRSANDAAVALAEHANGSMEAFVTRMNTRAAQLGMTATKYYNPNGLPPNPGKRYPWKSFNTTTCTDQLKLALEIMRRHPEITKYTSRKTWVMPDGHSVINHNNVMRMDKYKIVNPDGTEAIDGLKTGYIDAGGSSVVLTGTRNHRRVIAVILGSATAKDRDTSARAIMLRALEKVGGKTAPVAAAPAQVQAPAPKPVPPRPQQATVAIAETEEFVIPPSARTAKPTASTTPTPESKSESKMGFVLGLLVGMVGMVIVTFIVWHWLNKPAHEQWNFDNMSKK